jgi:phenylalanyl-tRNA synthetase beta subunit
MSELENIMNYFPFKKPEFKEKIVLPKIDTLIVSENLPKFEIERTEIKLDPKYNFIDLEKLQKIAGKKYTVAELRDIAKKLGIPVTQNKKELVKNIKIKIGLE